MASNENDTSLNDAVLDRSKRHVAQLILLNSPCLRCNTAELIFIKFVIAVVLSEFVDVFQLSSADTFYSKTHMRACPNLGT